MPKFKTVQKSIAKKDGVSMKSAGAILGAAAEKAKNPSAAQKRVLDAMKGKGKKGKGKKGK